MRFQWKTVIRLAALCLTLSVLAGDAPQKEYPSQHLSAFGDNAGLGFVLAQVRDLRELFSDKSVLQRRISKRCCAIDYAFKGAGIPKEIDIGDGSEVSELLMLLKKKWRGGQPQIRIISKDVIVQSPLGNPSKNEQQIATFLRYKVVPGDLVIIGYVE